MAKEKRMTKQVRVFTDTAHAISVIASALSVEQGSEVAFAEVVEEAIKHKYPELYDTAMKSLRQARSTKKPANG